MKLTVCHFVIRLIILHIFILVDIFFNSVTDSVGVRHNTTLLLVIFIVQDALLLLGVTFLCMCLFWTNVFKAGFVDLLLHRFKATIIIALFYIVITITVQLITLWFRWSYPLEYIWPAGLIWVYVVHRFCAVLYYYFYRRSVLRLSDQRFYDEEWVKHTLTHGRY